MCCCKCYYFLKVALIIKAFIFFFLFIVTIMPQCHQMEMEKRNFSEVCKLNKHLWLGSVPQNKMKIRG